ncbi:MAG: helix-turn-helix domain-containing protein [Paludibacteraceae bacterium]|nr:helix-turn-helix domain-containing protein [Paludibacteraceae bacterium]
METIYVLLCNIPAYICAILAIWRKFYNREFYAAIVYSLLVICLFFVALLLPMLLNQNLANQQYFQYQTYISTLIIPLLFLFHANESGLPRYNRFTFLLFGLSLLNFMPPVSIELSPAYAHSNYILPEHDFGISIYYHWHLQYHLLWVAFVLIVQAAIALFQLHKQYRYVKRHGGNFSWRAKAMYCFDFVGGIYLSLLFFFPIYTWHDPLMRWTYYICASIIIAAGSTLIFLGFDLNPIVDREDNHSTMSEFLVENSSLVKSFRKLMENELVYLEPGVQVEYIVQRLKTNPVYFERMMQAHFNCTFTEYVHLSRVRYAQQKLRDTDLTIEQIASESGYINTVSFVGVFKRIVGMEPDEWRDTSLPVDETLLQNNQ